MYINRNLNTLIFLTWESEAPVGAEVSITNIVPFVAPDSPTPPLVADTALVRSTKLRI